MEESRSPGLGYNRGLGDPGEGMFKDRNTLKTNTHPTVKSIPLMQYLITLISRDDQIILDPFAGSGSTLVAAKNIGRRWIGIEQDAEYIEIARARVTAYEREYEIRLEEQRKQDELEGQGELF